MIHRVRRRVNCRGDIFVFSRIKLEEQFSNVGAAVTKLQFISFPSLVKSEIELKFLQTSNDQSMEECIKIRRYEELPTSNDFESLIEAKNVPAVINQTTTLFASSLN
jgi:hypothetical protein